MNDPADPLSFVLGVVVMSLVGPGIAVAFLITWNKRRNALRRSPIGIDLPRPPGHALREQLEMASTEQARDVLLLGVIPLLALAGYLVPAQFVGLATMNRLAFVYLTAAVAFIAWMTRRLLRAGKRIDRLRAGFDAQVAVGQALDQLMRTGAAVFHDFPADGFNIDHIVVSVQGVFAVETKGYPKPGDLSGKHGATVTFDGKALKFPNWNTREPIEQSERQALWLSNWASSAIGEQVLVMPVVALPGWFVERTGRSVVRVYSGRALGSLLNSASGLPLSAQALQRIAHQIELRCRTVVPTYPRDLAAE